MTMMETSGTPARHGPIPRTPGWGLVLALLTALISGVAVFLNGYGVKAFGDAGLYTTVKNVVAAVLLGAVAGTALAGRGRAIRPDRRLGRREWTGLAVVAVIGGSVPFVLFFEGLARAGSVHAAFIQKTLVVWVALLAPLLLRERLRPVHLLAIALVLAGQAVLGGGVDGLRAGSGELMILAATLLWSAEVIVAKRLLATVPSLTLGVARMGLGAVLLVAWSLLRGDGAQLLALDAGQWGWVLLTGVILAAYVATWFAALARAGAIDVTAILVLAAGLTAVLDAVVKGTTPAGSGLVPGVALVVAGVALVALRARPHPGAGAAT